MKLLILILFSSVCFGQAEAIKFSGDGAGTVLRKGSVGNIEMTPFKVDSTIRIDASDTTDIKAKKDTLNAPVLSINEVMSFLTSINKKLLAVKELSLPPDEQYKQLAKELDRIVGILEKKRKAFK